MLPQLKPGLPTLSTSITNGGTFTSSNIDTLGIDWLTIDVRASTQAASTLAGAPTVLKLQESDSTSATTFVDIVGSRLGTATGTNVDQIINVGLTSGVNTYKFNIDCRARKRYINVVISPVTTQTFEVASNGGRAEQAPFTAAKAGVLNLLEF